MMLEPGSIGGLAAVALAGFVAGGMNAIAGGGTFLAFPVLDVGLGLGPRVANIACTLGLWPGSAASVVVARRDIATLPKWMIWLFAPLCGLGGAIGAVLLLITPPTALTLAIPWFLLFATLVFAFGKRAAGMLRARLDPKMGGGSGGDPSAPFGGHGRAWLVMITGLQFLIAIYGGYFGAGIGILTLAGLSLVGISELRKLNALKVVLSSTTNCAAVIVFAFGPVPWMLVGAMALASTAGGSLGMLLAQRLPEKLFRGIVLTLAAGLTVVYFVRVYGGGNG